jgi:membrane protein involved in colicin uptake
VSKKPRLGNDPLAFIQDSRKAAEEKAKQEAEEEANREADPQAEKKVNPQAVQKAGQKVKPQADPQAKVTAETAADKIKMRIEQGTGPELLQDKRTRRTYWLSDEEIKKIDKMAHDAGLNHYEIVGAAVLLLYDHIYKERGE